MIVGVGLYVEVIDGVLKDDIFDTKFCCKNYQFFYNKIRLPIALF
jgi:hypothetical protein